MLVNSIKRITNPKYVYPLLCVIFLSFCILFVCKESIIFPICISLITIIGCLLYKGKYRIYCFSFSIPFIVFFNSHKFGSFFTIIVFLYSIFVFVQSLIKKERIFNRSFIFLSFIVVYSMVLSLLCGGFSSFINSISSIIYFVFLFFLLVDFKSLKKKNFILFLFICSFLLSNLIVIIILYIIKGNVAINFLERFVDSDYALKYKTSNKSFRYPGLVSDPNYLGLYSLLILSLSVLSFNKNKRISIVNIVLAIFVQIFPLIGESKTYIVILLLLSAIFLLALCKKVNKLNLILFLAFFVVVFTILLFTFSSTILRFVNIDSRDGFINAMTTGRSNIQINYLVEFANKPFVLVFGKGIGSEFLNGRSAHSALIMSLWYFGFFGTIPFICYFAELTKIKCRVDAIPLVILALYVFSLDYIGSCEILVFLYFIYLLFLNERKDIVIYETNI